MCSKITNEVCILSLIIFLWQLFGFWHEIITELKFFRIFNFCSKNMTSTISLGPMMHPKIYSLFSMIGFCSMWKLNSKKRNWYCHSVFMLILIISICRCIIRLNFAFTPIIVNICYTIWNWIFLIRIRFPIITAYFIMWRS